MGAHKRKRQSTDSAIADMSSGDSLSTEPDTHTSDCNTSIAGSVSLCSSERRRSSCIVPESGFDIRDYGTAASQRPRRGAASHTPNAVVLPRTPTRESKRHKKDTSKHTRGTTTSRDGEKPEDNLQLSDHRVKGNSVDGKQTLLLQQISTELPTPPQTIEKTLNQVAPPSSIRKPMRERRPTERSRELFHEQLTPCGLTETAHNAHTGSEQSEKPSGVKDGESYIVRLRLPLALVKEGSAQSMSFTGSFSHRHKDRDSHDSRAPQQQSQSFIGNTSFQDYGAETFAQPQEEPILADSQELHSSQNRPDYEAVGSKIEVHLHEHLGISASPAREPFAPSGWISQQGTQRPFAEATPENPSQRQDHAYPQPKALQDEVAVNDDSWQTQPTMPWCPPWNAQFPETTQQATELESASFHASQATTIDEESVHLPRSQHQMPQDTEVLHAISRRLFTHRISELPKPEPVGRPAVWADARMDLCETLHYFRSYQGACHSTGGFVRGFMFDKVAHPRDYIDSNVVVARAGGGQVRDKDSGEMKASGDQVEGTVSQNLKNCMSHYNPVVIITGVDNPHIPSQPSHQYCVMDYFKPTHIWFEKSGSSKIVRYRFEKLAAQKDSWWRPKDIEDPIELGSLSPPVIKTCDTCSQESLQIYLNGWMCLQPTCTAFWLIPPSGALQGLQPSEPDEASLIYDPRFLKARTPWPNDTHSYPLASNEAALSTHSIPGEDTSEAFTRGVVCPLCGRCNPRISWLGWNCPCGWTKEPQHTLVPALSIREPLWPLTTSYTPSRDAHTALARVHVDFAHGYRINRYTLPGISGFITHMIANRTVVSEPGGPDDMFEELQRVDIGLRRRPLENTQLKGGMWTRHFAVNYGMPYKFIAATGSHPFAGAARPITSTRSRLNWAAKHLLRQTSPASPSTSFDAMSTSTNSNSSTSSDEQLKEFEKHEFNEVLALGYFESQKTNYHDDGEFGLGPTIATLSLGAPGTMRLRLKAKHHLGVSNAGVYTDALPLPGCVKYVERMERVDELRDLKATATPSQYKARLKSLAKELKLKASGNARDALTLKLGHGDIVIMHGADIQTYYEHAVEHSGKLRFALTCRYIDPESLPEKERPEYEVERDEGCYDGAVLGGSAAAEERGDPMDHTLT